MGAVSKSVGETSEKWVPLCAIGAGWRDRLNNWLIHPDRDDQKPNERLRCAEQQWDARAGRWLPAHPAIPHAMAQCVLGER